MGLLGPPGPLSTALLGGAWAGPGAFLWGEGLAVPSLASLSLSPFTQIWGLGFQESTPKL